MKLKALSFGLLSLSFMPALLAPKPAHAICVGIDVPTQIAVTSTEAEATQHSESQFEAEPGCFGSTTVSTGTQVYTGQGDVHQEQTNGHYLGGGGEEYYPELDPVFISVPTQVEVNVLPESSSLDGYNLGGYDNTYNYDANYDG